MEGKNQRRKRSDLQFPDGRHKTKIPKRPQKEKVVPKEKGPEREKIAWTSISR